jgi:glycerol-3-phosphate dehydrogenase (NAD(P)+)
MPAATRTATVLGAGAMGSALATPLRAAGWDTNLWGTWLDDHLLEACRNGAPHPRTGVPLAGGTALFDSDSLLHSLTDAEIVVVAIASVGVVEVVRRALPGLDGARALLLTSKGFSPDDRGKVRLLPDALRELAAEHRVQLPPIVAVGGPCKANEVAAGRFTAAIFGCTDPSVAERSASSVRTDAYRAATTDDEAGVEICAPMKNVYAIALGLADGLGERAGEPFHDLKAAIFAQAVRELIVLAGLVGGRAETAIGLAGVGDLEVTGLSGRNKVYGARIGKGESAGDALAAMTAAEQTVEGVPAARLARDLVDQRDAAAWSSLPLLSAILDTLDGDSDPAARIAGAVLPQTSARIA